ncbi:MAG: hypothetical protein MZU84_01140 [Sphingobacterium sp.]|nr:hypothetical protein [Sphingobacterium sp.]
MPDPKHSIVFDIESHSLFIGILAYPVQEKGKHQYCVNGSSCKKHIYELKDSKYNPGFSEENSVPRMYSPTEATAPVTSPAIIAKALLNIKLCAFKKISSVFSLGRDEI